MPTRDRSGPALAIGCCTRAARLMALEEEEAAAETRPRLAHAAFRWRQFPSSCGGRIPRMTTVSSCHVRQQLPALPANQKLGVPRSAAYSHADVRTACEAQ